MGASITTELLRELLIKYGGVPAKEAILVGDEMDEIRETVITLTNSQVKNLAATPQTLVAAPGAGKMLVLHDITLKLNYGGTNAFTVGAGDDLQVKYVGASGVVASPSIETTGWLDQTNDAYARYKGSDIATATAAQVANTALVLDNVGSEVAGNAANDNTVTVTVRHSVVDA